MRSQCLNRCTFAASHRGLEGTGSGGVWGPQNLGVAPTRIMSCPLPVTQLCSQRNQTGRESAPVGRALGRKQHVGPVSLPTCHFRGHFTGHVTAQAWKQKGRKLSATRNKRREAPWPRSHFLRGPRPDLHRFGKCLQNRWEKPSVPALHLAP